MPPGETTPPSINHSNYKDEKDKQRGKKKKKGGGWSQIERRDENTGKQTDRRKTCTLINALFHLRRRAVTDDKALRLKERGGFAFLSFFLFFFPFSSWVNLSVGDQQIWFAK